ncbi:MAG: hypothetical protein RMK29_04330 [Myxococcales bacterium]|nr:hypothetical protein [Myxococcales bacterium]
MRGVLLWLGATTAAVGLGSVFAARKTSGGIRESRFFRVDLDARKPLGPSDRVAAALHLDLISITTDQPQYWPREKVYLKVLSLGRPGAALLAKVARRDGIGREVKAALDSQGVAVVELLDGEKQPLELGEYRVDVQVADGKLRGSATFAVVEGALGALSFAHEFKKVTRAEELDRLPGGWFLGNAAGAGKRWGNGLSFKNELRISNHPFHGEVTVHSRCMLPGCDGIHAGPSQVLRVERGLIAGTLDVGGHSGPFQIEVVTARGSLRHQFEGSSHVERDMVTVAGGVSYNHRVGLAPYENTTQVPGRDLFIESSKGADDPFVVESVIAASGRLLVRTARPVHAPLLVLHQPRSDGSFEARAVNLPAELAAGRTVEAEVRPPYTLVTIGGFVEGRFHEGWAIGFAPGRLQLAIEAPSQGRPHAAVPLQISVRDGGQGASVSAVLEVFDNRVPSRSPAAPLTSALGDSIRNLSSSVSSWTDRTGLAANEPDGEALQDSSNKETLRHPMPRSSAPGVLRALRGDLSGAVPMASGVAMAVSSQGKGLALRRGIASGADAPEQEIREGERKVILCQRIVTDATGQARVQVQLPPQMGRLVVRLTAVRALDYASTQRHLDVRREAGIEARLPRALVPGARLAVPVDTTNNTRQPLMLSARGAGLGAPVERTVPPGQTTLELPLVASAPGMLQLVLRTQAGEVVDLRELPVQTVSRQPVTLSRLVFGDGSTVHLAAGEVARVYAGVGPLLRGVVMNVLTTTESWFGHAEALSARAAVRAVLLAAAARGLLDEEGLGPTLRAGLDKDVRDLAEAFCNADGLCRPYPALPPSPLWSAWVARNLLSMNRALAQVRVEDPRVAQATQMARQLVDRIQAAVGRSGLRTEELAGFNAAGEAVIPVEIDGKVVYRVLTDDAVVRWVSDKLLPQLGLNDQQVEFAFRKLYDTHRFLRAFERVGPLQYLTDVAMALYLQRDRRFGELYARIARGLILSQEPGLLQGPALLGGVYSTPMALVRFLELQLALGSAAPTAPPRAGGRALRYEEELRGPMSIELPVGAVLRADCRAEVHFEMARDPIARASVSSSTVRIGQELWLEITLSEGHDPLEYYALVAVPSTTSVKQTEDVLSDYRGQLLYGQQGQGGTQMQLLAVPFRGARTMRLLLEGAYRGTSAGLVVVRHIENRALVSGVAIPEVTVQ